MLLSYYLQLAMGSREAFLLGKVARWEYLEVFFQDRESFLLNNGSQKGRSVSDRRVYEFSV